MTKVVTHGHKMSLLGEGQFDILLDRQSSSQTACQLQLASQYQFVRFGLGQNLVGGGLGAQPLGAQPGYILTVIWNQY